MADNERLGELSQTDEQSALEFFSDLELQPGDEVPNTASRNMHMGLIADNPPIPTEALIIDNT